MIPLEDCQVRMIESLTRLAERPGSNLLDALFAVQLPGTESVNDTAGAACWYGMALLGQRTALHRWPNLGPTASRRRLSAPRRSQ
ncbi:MAG: Transcriptional regulator, LysR family [uncultured Paraburkholderia sp.]|nr:MAG: Transcriptional regulator, LysR family [uncultured Paraburkholderia sp.]